MKSLLTNVLPLFALCFPASLTLGQQIDVNSSDQRSDRVVYIENRGQITDENHFPRTDILFMGESPKSHIAIKSGGYSHQLHQHFSFDNRRKSTLDEPATPDSVRYYRIDMEWIQCETSIVPEVLGAPLRTHHYYNVQHAPEGITNAGVYGQVSLQNIYPGIDVVFHRNGESFEYDYIVAPNADHRQIKVRISGTSAYLNDLGELVLKTPLGTISESPPRVFQGETMLESRWIQLDEDVWGFDISDRNPEVAMTIDPIVRVWGTYYGGPSTDEIHYIKANADGDVFVVGGTQSVSNIATAGAHQVAASADFDTYIGKFDSEGILLWGTYVGGTGDDSGRGCDIDADGNLLVIGRTESTTNISTPGAHQVMQGDGGTNFDGFMLKFNDAGVRLWGTYYGGLFDDRARYIHIAIDGHIYLSGTTTSENAIATPGSHKDEYVDGTNDFGNDAFLVKFTADGVRLWATYYGGVLRDQGFAVFTDSNLDVYLWGHTQSSTDIATPGAHQTAHAGGEWDCYMAKFDSDGTRLWGTYVGGNNDELGWGGDIDANDNIYVTGRTNSPNGIATPGTHQAVHGGNQDAFLLKFNTNGDVVWGSYLGGNQLDRGIGCAVVNENEILLSGFTQSATGIATPGVHQETIGGGMDAFLSLFNSTGNLEWSTYYGGGAADYGYATTFFEDCYYLAGSAASPTNIATEDIHQPNHSGNQDGMLVKICPECAITYDTLSVDVCSSFTGPDNAEYIESGTYQFTLTNMAGCDSLLTVVLNVGSIETDVQLYVCENDTLVLPDNQTVFESGEYIVTFQTDQDCDSVVTYVVEFDAGYLIHSEITWCSSEELIDPIGNTIGQAGEYSFTLQSIYGCDSTLIWNVTFEDVIVSYMDITLCSYDVLTIPGGEIFLPGTYEVLYPTATACDSMVIWTVTYAEESTVAFTSLPASPVSLLEADAIQFFAHTNADSVYWDFGGLGSSFDLNPLVHYFESPGNFVVCLNVYDDFGCSSFYCESLRIEDDCTIYIPNAITANEDGTNDLFAVEGYGIDPFEFTMRIFNRYGEVIFETNDLNEKWNGAEPAAVHYAQIESYVYQVFAKCEFGTETKKFEGTISVIR